MSKRLLLASAFAFVGAAVPASADWSGLYIGAHVGGATGDVDWTNLTEVTGYIDLNTGDTLGVSPDGVLGGAQLGYNYVASRWLFGVEGTIAGMDFDDLAANPFAVTDEFIQSEIEWLATVAARAGFLSAGTLFYVKGGWAVGDVNTYHEDYAGGRQGSYSTDETHNGWVAGGGIEHAVSSDVSVGLEYNYIDLGEQTHAGVATPPFGGPVTNDVEAQLHTVTARLNWHFWP